MRDPSTDPSRDATLAYLRSLCPTREEVERFLTRRGPDGLQPNRGWMFDAELGWVHADAAHRGDGVGGTDTSYRYESDGARRVIRHADRPCRVHVFGDSFAHCDQVNDSETWPELLAARLGEPVRNYGVGGYGVYQAYRRMRLVESAPSAELVILNLTEDDHFRNLDAWRRIRVGTRTTCGFTLPYVRVDVTRDSLTEHDNPLRTPEDVFKLCDPEWALQTFADDPVLRWMLSKSPESRRLHLEAGLFATRRILDLAHRFLAELGQRLLVVFSYAIGPMSAALRGSGGEPAFDQPLLDQLHRSAAFPVIDLRDAFRVDFASSGLDLNAYLKHHYNGHLTPAGNAFTAGVLADHVTRLLRASSPAAPSGSAPAPNSSRPRTSPTAP
jgi:hypothetical protein